MTDENSNIHHISSELSDSIEEASSHLEPANRWLQNKGVSEYEFFQTEKLSDANFFLIVSSVYEAFFREWLQHAVEIWREDIVDVLGKSVSIPPTLGGMAHFMIKTKLVDRKVFNHLELIQKIRNEYVHSLATIKSTPASKLKSKNGKLFLNDKDVSDLDIILDGEFGYVDAQGEISGAKTSVLISVLAIISSYIRLAEAAKTPNA